MMFKSSLLTTAVLAGMVVTSAHAATSTVSGSATYGTAVTAAATNGTRVTSGTTAATTGSLTAFDTNAGVLTSVTLSAAYSTSNFYTLSRTASATGTGDSTETFSLTSGSSTVKTWTGATNTSVLGSSTPSLTGGSASFTDASTLALFTGSNLSVTGNAIVGASKTGGGGGQVRSELAAHSSTVTAVYNYVGHANASFTSGSTDTNSVTLTAGDSFNVFALGAAGSTAEMDSLSLTCTGDCAAFDLDIGSFSDAVAGSSLSGLTSLLATAAGSYNAVYTLTFTDDTAVGVGQKQNSLNLSLSGTVVAVPEPESAALFLAGLLAVGSLSRRRRND